MSTYHCRATKKILIVFAHPEPHSFNGALRDTAVVTLEEQGHEVQISDLYEMNFKAVADRHDFTELMDSEYLKYGAEQRHAYENGLLAKDILEEQQKLKWADEIIFIFPLWWHSAPAILKGWFDRIFTPGFAYGRGCTYETGLLKGRKAMLVITTGANLEDYGLTGRLGLLEHHLMAIQKGTLAYAGIEVRPPFITWQPAHIPIEQREGNLHAFRLRLLEITQNSLDEERSRQVNDGKSGVQAVLEDI